MVKNNDIATKFVEDFYTKDKNNILFWVAKTERYDPTRVISMCLRSGASRETAQDIASEIDKVADNRIKMSEIRPLIFGLLRERDPNAARKFKAEDVYIRTSDQTFERFNKDKITKSIMIEAEVAKEISEQIATEVEKFIKTSNLTYVSSPLIREIVNVKLLEYGLEDARRLYTRVGMPVYDITEMIMKGTKENANLQYNPETIHKIMADKMTKEYTLSKLLPRDIADSHIKGQIHIHDLDYFPTRPFCFSHDIRFFLKNGFMPDGTGEHASIAGPAKKPEVAFLHAAKILAAAQTNCAGGQGFSYFNTFMAPAVRGLNDKQMKQMAQLFIYEMTQMYVARGGQTVFSSIDLDMDVPKLFKDVPVVKLGGIVGSETYADYGDEIKRLFHAFLDVYMEGDFKGRPFNFPKMEVQLYPNDINNGKIDHELFRLSELAAKFGTPYYIINQPYMPDFACYQSMPYDEKIIIIRKGKIENVKIGDYVEDTMKNSKTKEKNGIEGKVILGDCNDYAISFNPETLKMEKMKIEKIMKHETKEKIFKITLDGNRTISATEKHKVPVVRNNKITETTVDNVVVGDFLIGAKNISLDFDQQRFVEYRDGKIEIDGKMARLLGYFASEGYMHKANKKTRYNKISFSFNIKETTFIKDVSKIIKDKFGLEPKFDVSEKNNSTTVYIYSKDAVELFEKIGTGYDAKSKRVPKIILNSSWYLIKEFMYGLFAGDGHFSNKIDLHLCNKDLIDDVFILGLRIGMPFEKISSQGAYSLCLTSSSRKQAFLADIPFSDKPLDMPCKTFDFYERTPVIPFNITRENLKTGHWNRCQIGKRVTENRLELNDELYSKFIKSDLHLFEVKYIEETKSKYVYDLVNVSKYHNFLTTDGIFSSNCCSFLMPLDKSSDESDLYNGTVRGGSMQVVTMNLPQIAYEAGGNDTKLFELLGDRMEKARRIFMLRKDLIENNLKNGMLPFMNQKIDDKGTRYLEPSKQSFTIGILGLNEMVAAHTGEELHQSPEAWKFGLMVMKFMKDRVAEFRNKHGMNFALARTPAESCSHRLARIDKRRYGDKAIVQGDVSTNAIYYTNSFHVRPNVNIPLFKRMSIEGSFHPLTDGGAMSHIWLGESNPNPQALMDLTKKLATKTALQYMSFTKDLTICDTCGAVIGGLSEKCTKCGSGHVQMMSRITGYYQNVKGWNKGKLQELKDRSRYSL